MADDVTVEADSAGHTDNRPLISLLPAILSLRDQVQRDERYATPPRVGAGGGISTPAGVWGAFQMGADYVVTGSINQACAEAATSPYVKQLLGAAEMSDVMMAPAADMFELGVRVQVLKRGTMFPLHAQRLYELYRRHPSLDAIPPDERHRLETKVFRLGFDEVWREVVDYFTRIDRQHLARAETDPKHRMALVFRWYLGNSSRWATEGVADRVTDMQIWCGQAMGAFNAWVKGTYLQPVEHRKVADVALHLLGGAAYLGRVNACRALGDLSEILPYIPDQVLA
jgi:PfaD family protein